MKKIITGIFLLFTGALALGQTVNITPSTQLAGTIGIGTPAGATTGLQINGPGATGGTFALVARDSNSQNLFFIDDSGGIFLPKIASDATHTDGTLCQDTTTHQMFTGSGAAGICLGTSSARFKTILPDQVPGLAELLSLRPVTYRYLPGYGDTSRDLYGFTAEQVQEVLPKLVGLDAEGRPQTVDWAGLVPILVNAIKAQQAEIEALKQKVR